jgi:palmitoyltransferase
MARRALSAARSVCCRAVDVLGAAVGAFCDAFDVCVRYGQPAFVLLAIGLIAWIAGLHFFVVLPQALAACSPAAGAAHVVLSLWLLGNVVFNYGAVLTTPPGSTRDASPQALDEAMGWDWRFCGPCGRPKPPLAHHCSVCNR